MKKWLVIGMMISGGTASAGCLELEQELSVKTNAISAQMQGLGACHAMKKLEQILVLNRNFFEQCREADPTGTTLPQIKVSLAQTRQNLNAICN